MRFIFFNNIQDYYLLPVFLQLQTPIKPRSHPSPQQKCLAARQHQHFLYPKAKNKFALDYASIFYFQRLGKFRVPELLAGRGQSYNFFFEQSAGTYFLWLVCYKHKQMSKGTFLEFQQMYRVLFKVQTVYLRLKEQVDVQVVIKKGQQNFIIPHKAKLINGVASLDTHAQFFVSSLNPAFDVFVMILHGSAKKFAGMCEVKLNQWQQNSNNQTTSILLKSPDANAAIVFNFMYLTCDLPQSSKGLMSLGELQSRKKSQIIKQVQDKYSYITKQNDRLNEQVASLKLKNNTLTYNNQQIMSEYTKNCSQLQQKMRQKAKEMQTSQYNLSRMKQKMQKLEEIVKNYGQASLKEKLGDLMQEYADK